MQIVLSKAQHAAWHRVKRAQFAFCDAGDHDEDDDGDDEPGDDDDDKEDDVMMKMMMMKLMSGNIANRWQNPDLDAKVWSKVHCFNHC